MEVAVYKGETFLCMGSVKECAATMKVKPSTIKYYLTPAYQRRIEKRKRAKNYMAVVRLDDEN